MAEQEPTQIAPIPEQEPQVHKHSPWPMIVALLALFVAAAVAVMFYLDRGVMSETQDNINQQSSAVDKLQSEQQLLNASLKEQSEKLQTLGDNLTQLNSSLHQDQQSWMLSEVDYLVRLANYNLQYLGDASVAKKLLEIADQRIESIGNPRLTEVRATLTNNITQLGGQNSLDVEKLLLRLNELSATVKTLPLSQVVLTAKETAAPQQNADENWQDKLRTSLSVLQTVVTVRQLSQPPKPLVTPDQHAYLVQNIQLQLSIAEWAVLHRKQELFRSALAQAKTWINEYFRKEDMTLAVVNGISELERTQIAANLPDLAPTVIAVHEAIAKLPRAQQNTIPSQAPSAPTAKPHTPNKPDEESKPIEQTKPEVLSS